MKPKISCVMPTRNRDDLISESIESIVNQTITDWELIIVDDHSDESDQTESKVSCFNDSRIIYRKLDDQNGKGIACARNFGNILASADIIAVLDSDDVAYPNRFKKSLEAFEQQKCDILYSEVDYWWPESGEVKRRDNDWQAREFKIEELNKINFIPHSTVMYSKKIARLFPYNSFFRRAEDYDFYLRVARSECKFYYIEESLTKYRKHLGAETKKVMSDFDYDSIASAQY